MSGGNSRELLQQLRACQSRLGTPAEKDGDFEYVLGLAHELNNQITAAYLRAAAESPTPEEPPTLVAVAKRLLANLSGHPTTE